MFFMITDARICQPQTTHLQEMSPDGVSAFCTKKPQILNPFKLQHIYRFNNISGIYRLSRNESHICYNGQVLPNMTSPAELSGGKYYKTVN